MPSVPTTSQGALKSDPLLRASKATTQASKPKLIVPMISLASKPKVQPSTLDVQATENDVAVPKKDDVTTTDVRPLKNDQSSKTIPESSKPDQEFSKPDVKLTSDSSWNVVASEELSRVNLSRWKLIGLSDDRVDATERAIAQSMPFYESSSLKTLQLDSILENFKTWKEMSKSIEKKLIDAFKSDNNFYNVEQNPGG